MHHQETMDLHAPGTDLRRAESHAQGCSLELPISKQFSPKQIDWSLREFLSLVRDHGPESGGTHEQARERIKRRFFSKPRRGGSEEKRKTQAGNAMSSARHWGLLTDEYRFTDVGRAALAAPDESGAAAVLAEHFLRRLGGAQTTKGDHRHHPRQRRHRPSKGSDRGQAARAGHL